MNYTLAESLKTSSQFTMILSQILKVHIPIVDNYQIENTPLAARLRSDMSEVGCIVEDAFQTGELQVMTEKRGHRACGRCPIQNSCQECFEIWAPIKVYDEVIGVVGFVSSSETQREGIMQNYKAYVLFLQQIAGLIAIEAIAAHEQEKKASTTALLESIIEQLETGVIVLNAANKLLRMNKKGCRILGKIGVDTSQIVNILPTGEQFLGRPEYQMILGKEEYKLIGKMYDINAGPYAKVFLFNDASSLEENALTLNKPSAIDTIIGSSQEINEVKQRIRIVATSSSSVIIIGETGVEKNKYAEAIHDESDRAFAPFIVCNCATGQEDALDEELFGTDRPYSGHNKGKAGKIELAHKGTLYLSDIHAMPLKLQKKLLHTLEHNEVLRLGARKGRPIDIRLISSTSQNLEELARKDLFLKELFFRISIIPLHIPSLRARKGDIRYLAMHYLNHYAALLNKNITGIDASFWDVLEGYDWLGNIWELKNTMEYVVNMLSYPGVITSHLLVGKTIQDGRRILPKELNLEKIERNIIERVLLAYPEKRKEDIARLLGIGVATLYRKIKKYDIAI